MSVVASARGGVRAPVRASALLAVLGVVYGDIGTSPLYAFKASLDHFTSQGVADRLRCMGILSLIFWSLIIIVTLKYVMLVMRADNRGEGGILALMALAQRATSDGRGRARCWPWSGSSVRACSSATASSPPPSRCCRRSKGWRSPPRSCVPYVVPISCAIIVGLFAVQYRGTGKVGRVFGPVMAHVVRRNRLHGLAPNCRWNRTCCSALSPHHLVLFCMAPWLARLRGHARLRGAGRDGGGGAVCRYGAFRRRADPPRLDRVTYCPAWC